MKKIGLILAAAAFTPLAAHAATYTYDFSALTAGTVPAANETPVPANTSFQGTTTIGQIGPDNWVWTSSTANINGAIVRSDVSPGMNGNFISAYTTASNSATNAAPSPYDSINSRKNTTTGFNYSIPSGSTFQVSFTASIAGLNYTNGSGVASTTTSRAQVALGYDQNNDGDIRGDAANTENAEWGPFFGFEPGAATGNGGLTGKFYVRPASLGTAVTANANGPGVYKILLDVDPTTNANATNGGFDGSGTLYVQQLFDATGAAVVDTLHAVTGLTNVNLGLSRMNVASGGGTTGGWNPANWNGLVTRVSNNGALDDIVITTPEPATVALLGLGGLTALRRRRA